MSDSSNSSGGYVYHQKPQDFTPEMSMYFPNGMRWVTRYMDHQYAVENFPKLSPETYVAFQGAPPSAPPAAHRTVQPGYGGYPSGFEAYAYNPGTYNGYPNYPAYFPGGFPPGWGYGPNGFHSNQQ